MLLYNVGYYGRNYGAEEARKEVDGKTSEEDKFFSSGDWKIAVCISENSGTWLLIHKYSMSQTSSWKIYIQTAIFQSPEGKSLSS